MKHNHYKYNEPAIGIKGFVQIKRLAAGAAEIARAQASEIRELRKHSIFAALNEDFHTERRLKQDAAKLYREFLQAIQNKTLSVAAENRNLVVTSTDRGVNLILRTLGNANADMTTYGLSITHGELGTGNTAPASTDTGLTTPADRQLLTLASMNSLTSLKLQFFWADAELANGTYKEIGTFAAGSSGLGTGQMINHALLTPNYTKASSEDTTMEINFQLTAI